MEENLLNELENFTSVKYLDDVTNNNTSNCCHDDEQVSERRKKTKHRLSNIVYSLGSFSCSSISNQRSTIDFSC